MSDQHPTNETPKHTVRLAIELELIAYTLLDSSGEGRKRFGEYYNTVIQSWLEKSNVASTRAWIVDNKLIVLSTPGMPPWDLIADVKKYLKLETEPITPLPTLDLRPRGWEKDGSAEYRTTAGSYGSKPTEPADPAAPSAEGAAA